MTDTLRLLWQHVLQIGRHYGVNPVIFGVLYIAHHPLFWGTMAWLANTVRRRRPVVLQVTLGVFFWIMPYGYVFLFGHGLPLWTWALAALVLCIGGTHAVREIRRRLKPVQTVPTVRPDNKTRLRTQDEEA